MTVTATITDPVSGEYLTFDADTSQEVERLIDKHFSVDLADVEFTGSVREERKLATALRRDLTVTKNKLDTAKRRLDKSRVEYASSPDGIAETYRDWELAQGKGIEPLGELMRAGAALNAEEFQTRVALGHSDDDDGLRVPLPLPGTQMDNALIDERITGTYLDSVNSRNGTLTVVTLMRTDDLGSRTRMTVPVTGNRPETLEDVIVYAWRTTALRSRLKRFLGDTVIADELDDADNV